MILGFSTVFPRGKGKLSGRETDFVYKVQKSLCEAGYGIKDNTSFIFPPNEFNEKYITASYHPYKPSSVSKKHTIRQDKSNRWKAEMMIDFFIGVRTKNMFRFAPRIEVKSIQKIKIKYSKSSKSIVQVYIDDEIFYEGISNFKTERPIKMTELAQNDGFNSVEDFFEYFNEDFTGKIIHWTDLKY